VTASTQTSNGLIESSYSAAAKPAEIVAHYEKELAGAGVQSLVNDDGIGISIRASAPECDLLIRVREREGASTVSVNCSDKSPAPAQGTYLPTGKVSPATAARPGSPRSTANPPTAADIRAKHDEIIANIKANMKKYDQPAYPQPGSYPASVAPVHLAPIALSWPSWFVTARGSDRGLQVERKKLPNGAEYLETEYKTSAPMSEIFEFYQDLMRVHGYRVRQGRLSTGSTSAHVQQNASGSVEGVLYPNGTGNGALVMHADFSRMFLNEPITVRLSVSVSRAAHASRN
jgi:hypothetical protein